MVAVVQRPWSGERGVWKAASPPAQDLDGHDPTLRKAAGRVRYRVRRDVRMDERDRTVRRLLAALDHGARTGAEGACFRSGAAQAGNREPRLGQASPRLLG